jgi:hypothetical protein
MIALLKNRLAYLGTSLVLLLVASPLISIGTTSGPRVLWWTGLAALCVGGLIPPVQRLFFAPKPSPAPTVDDGTPSEQQGRLA